MPGSDKFAAGRYAWGMCDICGVRTRYREMRSVTVRGHDVGLRVCPRCWDPDHPQNFLPHSAIVDGEALRNARPDTGLEASRRMYPPGNWPPYPSDQQTLRFRSAEEDAK